MQLHWLVTLADQCMKSFLLLTNTAGGTLVGSKFAKSVVGIHDILNHCTGVFYNLCRHRCTTCRMILAIPKAS